PRVVRPGPSAADPTRSAKPQRVSLVEGGTATLIRMARELTQVRPLTVFAVAERARLERRARLLAWSGNAWHVVEFSIAVGAGIAAGSIALIGFGADSLVEALAGTVIVWLFTGGGGASETAERRAPQLIAASFFILAAYVTVESVRDLVA